LRFKEIELADLRAWPILRFFNYVIYYRPVPDGIEVVRILHAARDRDAFLH
jgi:toxin ParE1/3/4